MLLIVELSLFSVACVQLLPSLLFVVQLVCNPFLTLLGFVLEPSDLLVKLLYFRILSFDQLVKLLFLVLYYYVSSLFLLCFSEQSR